MSTLIYGPGCQPAGQPFTEWLPDVLTPEPDHNCPGGQTTPGLLGGWVCRCECHQCSD